MHTKPITIARRFVSTSNESSLLKTPLYDLHVALGANMVPFAGYSMPILYKGQTHVQSHLWTRQNAGLFDVSHMLQGRLTGPSAIEFLHKITPTDFASLSPGQGTLSVLLHPDGGIVDDTMITKESDESFYMVTNAACAKKDKLFILDELKSLNGGCAWNPIENQALLALQGPQAFSVLAPLLNNGQDLQKLYFGQRRDFLSSENIPVQIARSGYTGEDGFEISLPRNSAEAFAEKLLRNSLVKPIGLAARDSLRLEAGMCLYGNELDENTTPIEAALAWVVSKQRRETTDGVKFNGYEKIMDQLNNKNFSRTRVLFKYLTKGPAARGGSKIYLPDEKTEIGIATSGSPSPSLSNINIGQAYINRTQYKKGAQFLVNARGKFYPISVQKTPLVPTHYYKA